MFHCQESRYIDLFLFVLLHLSDLSQLLDQQQRQKLFLPANNLSFDRDGKNLPKYYIVEFHGLNQKYVNLDLQINQHHTLHSPPHHIIQNLFVILNVLSFYFLLLCRLCVFLDGFYTNKKTTPSSIDKDVV